MAGPPVLLLIPPLTQLNTPYPSTAYLMGFLRGHGIQASQADLGIEMVLRLFCRSGLKILFDQVRTYHDELPGEARQMLAIEPAYLNAIDPVIEFLQGRNPSLALLLARSGFLPQGPRFSCETARAASSHVLSDQDRAKRLATLFLEDLADLAQATVSPHFTLSRYAEHIARAASSFETIIEAVDIPPTLTDRFMLESLWEHLDRVNPLLVCLTVPFPGNLYGAFRVAHSIKTTRPDMVIALGGGYANTELRRLSDPRVFDYVDYVTLDDGERPLLSLIEHLAGTRPRARLCRTFYRDKDQVVFANDTSEQEFNMDEVGCPTYSGLTLDRYLTILDSTNPMHRLWSEGHWNKLTVAHGCYWKQCTFCDVGLNYISRYEMTPTDRLIQQIEQLITETPERGGVARKLKADRILFMATLLLVCTSVVMVYSASALVALERFQQPYLFVTRQAMWTVLGLAVLWIAMHVDYRTYRNDVFLWALLGVVAIALVGVLFESAGERDAAVVRLRRVRDPALRAREDRLCLRHSRDSRAAQAPDRRAVLLPHADRDRGGPDGGVDPAPAGFRDSNLAAC